MKVTTTLLGPSGSIPNNPTLPLLHYHGVVDVVAGADAPHAFEALFESHGWSGSWRNGIMGFHHYHTSAHEVLGIY
ncbi:MAG: cupin, partial [Chromatiales bacterium]|nr:cupin [Chromatiales bacterium]